MCCQMSEGFKLSILCQMSESFKKGEISEKRTTLIKILSLLWQKIVYLCQRSEDYPVSKEWYIKHTQKCRKLKHFRSWPNFQEWQIITSCVSKKNFRPKIAKLFEIWPPKKLAFFSSKLWAIFQSVKVVAPRI